VNFGFTEEQELLRSEVRKLLDERAPIARVREVAESEAGFDREVWGHMAELGWVGLTIPEEHGGAGTDLVTLVVVLEESGRTLFPSPLVSTTLAVEALLRGGSEAQRGRWLPELAKGSRIGTLALLEEDDGYALESVRLVGEPEGDGFRLTGEKVYVPDAAEADLYVVPFRGGSGSGAVRFAVLDRAARGVAVTALPGLDPTKRLGTLSLDGAAVAGHDLLAAPAGGDLLLARLLDVGAALVTAEAVGAAEGALRLTADYARARVQFGAPIGRFQGVKHPLAEAYVDIESFKSLVYYAAWALDHGTEDASLAVSRAKAYASECFPRFGIDTVQLHGGIGYTWEYDAQLYLKRAKWFRPVFGDADHHYDRVAALGGL
jgi:alkylation response protein AidB-like acyl-CoA dehydrogenase